MSLNLFIWSIVGRCPIFLILLAHGNIEYHEYALVEGLSESCRRHYGY